ncbi:Hypothetical_protein [Hexamita inflata]|uniref:Hypothetical_protein n=1 Tax=Hexamita inflata TaxID=28002 RepID=A0AA86PWQ5_9EUKA|nr:Hypothetical protein HINF_LOCUS35435 [Hexamita inflata]
MGNADVMIIQKDKPHFFDMCVTQLGPSMQCEFILKLEIHAKKLSTTLVQNIKLNVKLYTASTSRDRKLSDSLRPLKNESQNMVSITRTVAVIINKVVMLLGEIVLTQHPKSPFPHAQLRAILAHNMCLYTHAIKYHHQMAEYFLYFNNQ